MKKVLTIASSDCSGGAGIQADLKTFAAHKVYGTSVLTAVMAQNTRGVFDVVNMTPDFLATQLDCVLSDIPPDAVKVGMIPNKEMVNIVASKIKEYNVRNVVLDPVMMTTLGDQKLEYDVVGSFLTQLMPLTAVITPNMAEVKVLCGMDVRTKEDMLAAAAKIQEIVFVPILIKGGGLKDCSDDLLYYGGEVYWFKGPHIDTKNIHGTGCTLSAAIASQLALDNTLEQSVRLAKVYLTGALTAGLQIGKGVGPVHHGWNS